MNRPVSAVVPLAALLMLSGCVAGTTSSDNTPAPTTSATGAPPPTGGSNPGPLADDATVIPVPEAASSSQQAAIAAAENIVVVFGRPDLPYRDWIDGLYPLMTQAGAAAYEDTDPRNVPVHQVTGPATILDGSTEVALVVRVPTDAGSYNVSLSRTGADAPWLADRIRPAGA